MQKEATVQDFLTVQNEGGRQVSRTHLWKEPSHDRWLIVDSEVYHCGHSLKDMGQKLSAISHLSIDADDILKHVK